MCIRQDTSRRQEFSEGPPSSALRESAFPPAAPGLALPRGLLETSHFLSFWEQPLQRA